LRAWRTRPNCAQLPRATPTAYLRHRTVRGFDCWISRKRIGNVGFAQQLLHLQQAIHAVNSITASCFVIRTARCFRAYAQRFRRPLARLGLAHRAQRVGSERVVYTIHESARHPQGTSVLGVIVHALAICATCRAQRWTRWLRWLR